MGDSRDVQELRSRTKRFAVAIVKFYCGLPKTTEAQVLGRQVLKSGTSVGAYYREANRARSDAEFVSKIEGALQELDETAYWLELLTESGITQPDATRALMGETEELTAIFVTIVKNTKQRMNQRQKDEKARMKTEG